MDPVRLQLLLAVAFSNAQIPLALATDLYAQAVRQLYERWPLAGCAVKYDGAETHVIAVGRQ